MKPEIPSIDTIVEFWSKKDLLVHKEKVLEIAPKVQSLCTEIDPDAVRDITASLLVFPLIRRYHIKKEAIKRLIKRQDQINADQLKKKFDQFRDTGDYQHVTERLHDTDIHAEFVNPYKYTKNAFLRTTLQQIDECRNLKHHIRRTCMSKTKLLHDAQMGGSYHIIGKDKDPLAYKSYTRSFGCVNKNDEIILFMDSVEGGHPWFKSLEHWRGKGEYNNSGYIYPNRINELFMMIASTVQLARNLGIKDIALRDFEVMALAKQLGIPEKHVFREDKERKIGIRSRQNYTGIYTHCLYRADSVKSDTPPSSYRTLDTTTILSYEQMKNQFTHLHETIIQTNQGRRKPYPKTAERLTALEALEDILINHPYYNKLHRSTENANSYLQKQFLI